MSLFIVATPIGHKGDLTERAKQVLSDADLIIGEERRELMPFLKTLNLHEKKCDFLNEHSKKEDLAFFLKECEEKSVALVSDCGTPGFCDPGAELVALCRQKNIKIIPIPGASSLMAVLSVSGLPLKQFVFCGFLSSEKSLRDTQVKELRSEKRPVVLMDTPYRLSRLLSELSLAMPTRNAVLGLDLTQPTEEIVFGTLTRLSSLFTDRKAEFILILEGNESFNRK
jgi:16S rRNA (cytidine1402-2'-O)-methyltransferase